LSRFEYDNCLGLSRAIYFLRLVKKEEFMMPTEGLFEFYIKSDILFVTPCKSDKRRNIMTEEHKHPHHDTKKVMDRMSRAIGHMESIKKMIEEGRDCSEILIQLSAVRSAINNVGKIILQDHVNHCVVDAVETGDKKVLENLNNAVDKFLK